jgi:hypothetical protein
MLFESHIVPDFPGSRLRWNDGCMKRGYLLRPLNDPNELAVAIRLTLIIPIFI